MPSPQLDKILFTRVALAYAVDAPFWVAGLVIMWNFGASSSQLGYIGYFGCLAGGLIVAGFVMMVSLAIWTVSKIRHGINKDQFIGLVIVNVGVSILLDITLLCGLAVLTYRFPGD